MSGGFVELCCYAHGDAEFARVEEEWRALEEQAASYIFLSWDWIASWLQELVHPDPVCLVRVYEDESLIGLTFVTLFERRIIGRLSHVVYFNEYPAPGRGLLREKNGCLAVAGRENEVFVKVLEALAASDPRIEEFQCRGFLEHYYVACCSVSLAMRAGAALHEQRSCWLVGKKEAALSKDAVLSGLSRNRRWQIARSFRVAEERWGPLKIRCPVSLANAAEFFEGLDSFHTRYWQARGRPGVFADRRWRAFHWALIERLWPTGRVHLLQVVAGESVVGYVYNLGYHTLMSNIQTGFAYEDDNRWRPGLVSHLLAADMAGKNAYAAYDLLMGDEGYKSSIGREGERLVWFSLFTRGRSIFGNRRLLLYRLLERYRRVRTNSKPKAHGDSRSFETG